MRLAAWNSIERKLPLSIILLLTVFVAGIAGVAYRQMKVLRLEATGQRLVDVANDLARLSADPLRDRLSRTQEAADDSAVVRFLSGDRAAGDGVRRALDSLAASHSQITGVQVWGADGLPVPVDGLVDSIGPERGAVLRADSAYVTPLRMHGDRLVTDAVAPVRSAEGDVIGFVMQRRYSASAEQSRRVLSGLIGDDAVLLVGNRTGGFWSDLVQQVSPPSIDLTAHQGAVRYTREDAGPRLGAGAAIPGSPWLFAVEFPLENVLAPARAFLRSVLYTVLIVVLLGAFATWMMTRRLTVSLRDVTRAASAIARGDYSSRLESDRRDELGQLADAFNVMASKVEDAHHGLEEVVADRTRELEQTLQRLRSAQEELVRKEKLALVGKLSSGLGHELRTPLGVMTNALYVLRAVAGDVDPRVGQYLDIIREQVGLSEKIVNDLLDFARVRRPDAQAVALPALVDEQLARAPCSENVRIVRQYGHDAPPAWIDPVQIGQVLLNLVTNAQQAMCDTGGTLTVTVNVPRDDAVSVAVRDTGRGVAAADLDRIFEPLFTTKARGIGLGLAISRAFVDANGGSLEVESTLGRGSTFTVTVPVAVPAVAQ